MIPEKAPIPPRACEMPWEGPQLVTTQMRRTNNLIFRKTKSVMREYNLEKITPMHSWILGYLYKNRETEVFQRDIERDFSITRSTVTNILQLMEQKGYIERRSVPHDARLKRLVLTDEGARIHERTMQALHSADDSVQDILTPDENAELLRLLEKLRKGLE